MISNEITRKAKTCERNGKGKDGAAWVAAAFVASAAPGKNRAPSRRDFLIIFALVLG
ncbi:hypothetical protein [Rhizobium freirei]|uniref:hypothetical protein n=1 Tax=Rhizobium freirei TaxID=1353277 RepID=UPI0012FA3555|nr:hypothetical protein [Rhizobium freirei]